MKARLNSTGKAKSQDDAGNVIYIDTDIFQTEMLEAFIELSISQFNQTPFFTSFTIEDTEFVNTFTDLLVEGAVLHALASQSLLERGREFQLTDSGVTFNPPSVSELLNTQWVTVLEHHHSKLKDVKSWIKSFKNKE